MNGAWLFLVKNTNVSNISINTRSLPRWLIPAPLAPGIKGHNHISENLSLKGSTNFQNLFRTICQTFSRPHRQPQDPKITKLKGALLLRGSLSTWPLESMDTIWMVDVLRLLPNICCNKIQFKGKTVGILGQTHKQPLKQVSPSWVDGST